MDLADISDEERVDQLATWAVHGVSSWAHWLTCKIGDTSGTARERVRVARALRSLPLTAAALGAGRVSYAQVRALTRFVTAADEGVWLDLARHSTAAQLEAATRGAARAKAADQPSTERPTKPGATVRWDDDGDLVLTLRFPAHEAVGVLAALEQHQGAAQTERDTALAALAVELTGGPDVSASNA